MVRASRRPSEVERDTCSISSWLKGYLARQLRTLTLMLAVILGLVVLWAGGRLVLQYIIGSRSFDNPPKVGEPVSKVVERLGPPSYDSREDEGEEDEEYLLGYTNGMGVRYHLTVKNGVITDIKRSSR